MQAYVKRIDEVASKDLFELGQYMLGDNDGKFIVVSGVCPVGRYVKESDAQKHANLLNEETYP